MCIQGETYHRICPCSSFSNVAVHSVCPQWHCPLYVVIPSEFQLPTDPIKARGVNWMAECGQVARWNRHQGPQQRNGLYILRSSHALKVVHWFPTICPLGTWELPVYPSRRHDVYVDRHFCTPSDSNGRVGQPIAMWSFSSHVRIRHLFLPTMPCYPFSLRWTSTNQGN
jgi:hypothetical protein